MHACLVSCRVTNTLACCRSIIKSGRPLNEEGAPVLGHAQRAPPGPGEAPPPATITKELQALMADLRLEDPSDIKQVGSMVFC